MPPDTTLRQQPYIKKTSPLFLLLLLAQSAGLFAQPVRDTVLYGRNIRFNYYTHYGNPLSLKRQQPVLCIGIMKTDSIRTGNWYFFYPSGKLLAYGKYENGLKKGTWTYYSNKGTGTKVNWNKTSFATSKIIFDDKNDPVICDITGNNLELFNGKPRNTHVPVIFK